MVTSKVTGTKTYDVVFYDSDGRTVLFESTLEYGATVALPTPPKKNGYTFKGWTGYTADMTVNGDMQFVAVYEKVIQNPDVEDDEKDDGSIDTNENPSDGFGGLISGCVSSIGGISVWIGTAMCCGVTLWTKRRKNKNGKN